MERFVTRYDPGIFETPGGACTTATRTGGTRRGFRWPTSLALGAMGLLGNLLTPMTVLGGGSPDSPGQTVVSVVRHRVVDLPTLNQKVDPTDKVTAEEYWHVLEALKSLRAGTPCTALSVKQKEAAAKLGLDCKNVSLVELLPYRDDPLYAVDESLPLGQVQLDDQGKPKCRDCPLVAVELTKLPYEIKLSERFISVGSATETEKTTYGFRVVVPLYRRKPEGDLGPEPVRLRFPLLTEAPKRGSLSVCAPVTESGDLVELGAPAPGGTASPSVLYRRGYSAADQIVFFDNNTFEGRAATAGRKRITTYDIAEAATLVPGTSMVRGLDGQPLWNLGDGWAVRKDLQLYRHTHSGWDLVPGPPELPTNAVAADGTPIWLLGNTPPGPFNRGSQFFSRYERIGVAPDGAMYASGPKRGGSFPVGPGFYPVQAGEVDGINAQNTNDLAWAAALINHNLAGEYVIRPTPRALWGAVPTPTGEFPFGPWPLMGTDSVGTDGRSYLAWPDPDNPGWGVSPEGLLYFQGAPSTQVSAPPEGLKDWAASFGTFPYRGSAARLPTKTAWSIDGALKRAYVTHLKAALSYFYDWGDRQFLHRDNYINPVSTMGGFLAGNIRSFNNVYGQAIAAARKLGISFSSPLPRFLVLAGDYSVTPIAGFDGIILHTGKGNPSIALSGAPQSGLLVWNRDLVVRPISNHVVRFTGSAKLGLMTTLQFGARVTYTGVPDGTHYNVCVDGGSNVQINGEQAIFQSRHGFVGGAYRDGCQPFGPWFH